MRPAGAPSRGPEGRQEQTLPRPGSPTRQPAGRRRQGRIRLPCASRRTRRRCANLNAYTVTSARRLDHVRTTGAGQGRPAPSCLIASSLPSIPQSLSSPNIRVGTRTQNLRLRRPTLYPIELRGHALVQSYRAGIFASTSRKTRAGEPPPGLSRVVVAPKAAVLHPPPLIGWSFRALRTALRADTRSGTTPRMTFRGV